MDRLNYMSSNYHAYHSWKYFSESFGDPDWGPAKWRSHSAKYSTQCLQLGLERQSYWSWVENQRKLAYFAKKADPKRTLDQPWSTLICLLCLMWFIYLCSPADSGELKTLVWIRSSNHDPTNIDFQPRSVEKSWMALSLPTFYHWVGYQWCVAYSSAFLGLLLQALPGIGLWETTAGEKGKEWRTAMQLGWIGAACVAPKCHEDLCMIFTLAIAQATQKNKLAGHNKDNAIK